ncbi:MAG: PAS domain S-box protein, partial [Defluviitaleaceae bacterium]|nr:PAS domain S-box protein [Defluviitaleaceae bacterium]
MSNRKSKSVVAPIFALMVTIILALAVAANVITYLNTYTATVDSLTHENRALNNLIDGWIRSMGAMAENNALLLRDPNISREQALSYFTLVCAANPDVSDVYAGFADNTGIFGMGWEPPDTWEATQRPWFRAAAATPGRVVFPPPYFDTSLNQLAFATVRTVNDHNADGGVVAIDIPMTTMAAQISAANTEGQRTFLLGVDGDVLIHPDPKFAPNDDATFKNINEVDNGRYAQMFAEIRADGYSRELDYIYIASSLESTGWYIVTAVSYSIIMETVLSRFAVVMAFIALILVISLPILFRIDKTRIKGPLAKIAAGVESMARGEISTLDISASDSTEVSSIIVNLNDFANIIKGMTDDLNRLTYEINVNGELEYRIDTGKYRGSYKEMTEGINAFTDKYVSEVLMVLGLIGEVGGGNFNVEIPELPGKKIVLKQKFTEFLSNIKNVKADIDSLAATAAGGDLNAQADVRKYTGDWAQLLNNLNNLVQSIAEKANWYESLLDAIPFPISVTDNNMNWTFINKPTEMFLGKTRKDVAGQHCSNWGAAICNTDQCGISCLKRGVMQTKFTQNGMHFQVNVTVLKDLKGNDVGYIEVVQDTTTLEASVENVTKIMRDVQGVSQQVSEGSRQISQSSQALAD